jgi:UDP-N-acetylmuramyl tripeptide synthase
MEALLRGRSPARLAAAAGAHLAAADPGPEPVVPDPEVPVVQVTGTNGKTTTVRLLAHIVRSAELHVAYSSTDGVYRGDGELIEHGDYSGFGGAAMALAQHPDVAVLETARGGLLLRGSGVLHNDVAVVTNVSEDHLGLQGVDTVDQLAEVKAIITKITRPGGWDVLNADDPRVLAMRRHATGRPWVFSLDPDHPAFREVLSDGGRAMTVMDGKMTWLQAHEAHPLVNLLDVPVSMAGVSSVYTQNAMAAAAAALAVGVPARAVAKGLRTFVPDAERNPGRANVFTLEGRIIVIDYAHNEAGVMGLTELLDGLRVKGREVWVAICTAGDRTDAILRAFAFRAAVGSDHLAVAELVHYLRGRSREDLLDQMRAGAGDAGGLRRRRPRGRTACPARHASRFTTGRCDQRDGAGHAPGDLRVAQTQARPACRPGRGEALGQDAPGLVPAPPPRLAPMSRNGTRFPVSAMEAPVVVASNRAPVTFERNEQGKLEGRRGAGGLVTALSGVFYRDDTTWVAAASTDEDRAVALKGRTIEPDSHQRVRFVTISPERYEGYYNQIANRLLWFVHHASGTSRGPRPSMTPRRTAWTSFVEANRQFALALADESDRDPVYLIQDYHLCLVPGMLRDLVPDAKIVHFSHTPFAGATYLRILPVNMREALLRGMAGADVLGFQSRSSGRRTTCCRRAACPGLKVLRGGRMEMDGHTGVRARVPGGGQRPAAARDGSDGGRPCHPQGPRGVARRRAPSSLRVDRLGAVEEHPARVPGLRALPPTEPLVEGARAVPLPLQPLT